MTHIDFYFNAEDRFQVACRLAAKAVKQSQRMLIYAPDPETASRIDKMLWTWPAIGFVPHCAAHSPLAAETPVLIASEAGPDSMTPPGCEVMLNLGRDCPPHFERFSRLLEVVPSAEGSEIDAGRTRYRFYRERGYKIANHDLAQGNE
ncbi:MAG: putative polymerase chi subunit [Burkholderiales bacterium]|nr:putative polymerase chi subunit [Burkholderiales bacterium]